MRFGVLGPLEVWTDGGTSVAVTGGKVRALLAVLLVYAGEPVSEDRLIEALWREDPPHNPRAALQAMVSRLRRALDEAEPRGRELVVSQPPGYLLRVPPDSVDTARFARLVSQARDLADPRTRADLLADALAIWRGPALAEYADEPFALAAITRLNEQRLAAYEDHAEARLELGDAGPLLGELAELAARHPLRERLQALHLRALYQLGRQAEALAAYRQVRDRLVEHAGVEPGPELTRMHRAMLDQDPGLAPSAAKRPVRLERPRTNLPTPLSSFVGRAGAVADVRKLLDAGRLVTLTGPGGVGKTRLAIETAAQLVDELPDGSWAVDLAGVTDVDAGRLAEHVAAALSLRDDAAVGYFPPGPRAQLPGRLVDALRDKQLLLVLDNCEHVLDPVADLAALLLQGARGLCVLATSREPLGLAGEQLWPVPPLELPAGDEPAALERSSAVQLFAQRAGAVVPGFAVDAGNAAPVADICRRLDGLPLALELAAGRVRAYGVHQLADRLGDRFRLLTAGARDAPARHETLRAVIDWSWELLSVPEQATLRRLAVHVDGWTLAAAEAVAADDASTACGVVAGDVPDLLARLVDRSLVVAEHRSAGTRYRLLETIQAYALERLDEAGETHATRWRHARCYLALAEQANTELRGHDQQRWLERLDAESANLTAALEWLGRQGDPAAALRLAGALGWYWFLRGRHRTGYRSFAAALATTGDQPTAERAAAMVWLAVMGATERIGTDPARPGREALDLYAALDDPVGLARAQWLLGLVAAQYGDAPVPWQADDAVATFRRLDDGWHLAVALTVRAWDALRRSELASARRDARESRARFDELGDRWGQARTAELLGVLAEIAGDYAEADRRYREGLELAETLGLWPSAADLLSRLGRLAILAGDYATADDYHERALRLARDQSSAYGVTFAQTGLGISARRQGLLDEAERYLRAALEVHRVERYWLGTAFLLAELGFVAEHRGDADAARSLHLEGLAAARESHDPRSVALALEGLAGAEALAGNHAGAAQLLGAAVAARESTGAPLPPAERGDVDRIAATVTAALGKQGFETLLRQGRELDLDAVRLQRGSFSQGSTPQRRAQSS